MGHLRKISTWIRWEPDTDTLAAVLSALVMIPLYYLTVHATGWFGTAASIAQMVILGVAFPVWWIMGYRKKPLCDLGITPIHWIASLVAGIVLALLFSVQLMTTYTGSGIIPHLIVNACMFWEPFFVYGWLLLCFDRAFGIIPGILFSAIAFGAYHIGTYPVGGILMLMTIGVIFGCIFRTTKNLLILWPFAWTISSSIGTVQGGMLFGWDSVAISAIFLIVSLVFIAVIWSMQGGRYPLPPRH